MSHRVTQRGPVLPPTVLGMLGLALAACGGQPTEAERLFEKGHARIERQEDSAGVAILRRILEEHPDSPQAQLLRRNWNYYEELLAIEAERGPVQATRDLRRFGEALEAYRRRRGRYPDRLLDLVPAELDAIPEDPWERDYRYRRRGGGYLLATLGADAEEGGRGPDRDIRLVDGILQNAAAAGLRDGA